MPVFNTLTLPQQEILEMASTDIRSIKATTVAIADSLATQAAAVEAQNARVVTMESSMVIEKSFSVAKAAFSQNGIYWVYDLVHGLNNVNPSSSIFDADGDLQLIQTKVQDANTLRLELSAEEYADNSFPLEVAIQAKSNPVVTPVTWFKAPTMAYHWRVLNGELQNSQDGVTALNASFAQGIVKAAIGGNGLLYIQNANGYFGLNDNDLAAGFVAATEGDYPTGERIQFTLA